MSDVARGPSRSRGRNKAGRAVLDVRSIWKRFDKTDVVRDVSFSVDEGYVLGVVGPNGAGKTTSIRIALGILPCDKGTVEVLGEPLTQATRERVGYLPEERGLYERRSALDTLGYLGQLKGLSRKDALERAERILERVNMHEHRHKKVSELSHGMAQLVQVTATVMHEPALVVLDEPFTALDPVNVRLLKGLVRELREQGTALVLCTHQMNQVEDLCDEVVMIHKGSVKLSGRLSQIKRRHKSNVLRVVCDPPPDGLRGVADVQPDGDGFSMRMRRGTKPEDVLKQLLRQGRAIERFERALPSMEDIFVSVVSGEDR